MPNRSTPTHYLDGPSNYQGDILDLFQPECDFGFAAGHLVDAWHAWLGGVGRCGLL